MKSNATCLCAVLLLCLEAVAQPPAVLPTPKKITCHEGHIAVVGLAKKDRASFVSSRMQSPAVRTGIVQVNEKLVELGGVELPSVTASPKAPERGVLIWIGIPNDLSELTALLGCEQRPPAEMHTPDGYLLRCIKTDDRDVVVCLGHDERGCYYALQTLVQLLRVDDGGISLPCVEIVDWPTYRIRLVKNSATNSDPGMVEKFARLLPRYKINVYALQYHKEKDGTWREPSEAYRNVIEKVGEIARRDGVLEPGLFLCPFLTPRIDLTKESDVNEYVERLRWGIRLGYKWVEVDFNDWARWETIPEEQEERFGDLGTYMAYLTNAAYEGVRKEFPDVGVIVCPSSPWYRGPAWPEIVTLCKNIPDDILVYWTGPYTRSREIRAGQVEEWTEKTGRKPFLWDNTIYAHFRPYLVGYAFNPYLNDFPDNMPDLLAGPGIHLNATAATYYIPGILTYADYLWNPEGYNPQRSIRAALEICWGKDAPEAAQEVQDRLLAIYKLLFEAGKGWMPYDRKQADEMVSELQTAVERLAGIVNEPDVTATLEKSFLGAARRAVETFDPPAKLTPRPTPIARPLADGVVNPSAEEVVDGKPVGWCVYRGAGAARMTVSNEAHSGKHSVCLEATEWYHDPKHPKHGNRKWINVALIHGSDLDGFQGRDAYDGEPSMTYRCTFWLKGDAPVVNLQFQAWSLGLSAGERRALEGGPAEIHPTGEWQQYTATFTTRFDTRKLALKFSLSGYEDEGMTLAKIWVDDVSIEPAD